MMIPPLAIAAFLVLSALLGLFLLSIHLKEMRRGERRRLRLFAPIEQRRRDRRSGSLAAYLAWAMGAGRS